MRDTQARAAIDVTRTSSRRHLHVRSPSVPRRPGRLRWAGCAAAPSCSPSPCRPSWRPRPSPPPQRPDRGPTAATAGPMARCSSPGPPCRPTSSPPGRRRAPRPPPRTAGPARSPARSSPASRAWSTTATARSGRCPTTGSAPRPTRPTSCCASTTSTPDWETRSGGAGAIDVGEFISLRDPDRRIPFPIVNDATPERLLTGRRLRHRVGRAGPRRHVLDRRGVRAVPAPRRRAPASVLAPPVAFPDGKSPANPYLAAGRDAARPLQPRVRGDGGVAATGGCCTRSSRARSPTTRSPRRRYIYEFDTGTRRYTGRTWQYETDTDANVIGDAFTVERRQAAAHRARRLRGPGVGDQAALRGRSAPHRRRRLRRQGAGRRPAADRQPRRHRHGRRARRLRRRRPVRLPAAVRRGRRPARATAACSSATTTTTRAATAGSRARPTTPR